MDVIGPTTPCETFVDPVENGISIINQQLACNYTTPDGVKMTLYCNGVPFKPSKYTSSYSLYISARVWWDPRVYGLPSLGDRGAIVTVTSMQPHANFELHGNSIFSAPVARRCTLSFCAKEFVSSIEPGRNLNETFISTKALRFENCTRKWYEGISFLTYTSWLEPCVGVKETTITSPAVFNSDKVSTGTTLYKIGRDSLNTLLEKLQTSFPYSPSLYGHTAEAAGTAPPTLVGDALQYLHESNIELMFDNIADSLTNWIRASSNGTSSIGDAWEQRAYVHVSWAWLALPAAIVALTTVFLVASIIFSLEKSQLVWKSSALALLFHRLQGWGEMELNKRTQKDMEEAAKDWRVHLIDDSEGNMSFVKA